MANLVELLKDKDTLEEVFTEFCGGDVKLVEIRSVLGENYLLLDSHKDYAIIEEYTSGILQARQLIHPYGTLMAYEFELD